MSNILIRCLRNVTGYFLRGVDPIGLPVSNLSEHCSQLHKMPWSYRYDAHSVDSNTVGRDILADMKLCYTHNWTCTAKIIFANQPLLHCMCSISSAKHFANTLQWWIIDIIDRQNFPFYSTQNHAWIYGIQTPCSDLRLRVYYSLRPEEGLV